MSNRTASENRPESAAPKVREEPVAGERIEPASPSTASLWDQVLERTNLQRALSVRDAWQMAKSAHGPWRLSHTPALARALPAQYFADLGLPRLVAR